MNLDSMPVNKEALEVWKESIEAAIIRLEGAEKNMLYKIDKLSERVTKGDIKSTALVMLWSLNALIMGFSLYKIYDMSILVGRTFKP